MGKKQTKYRKHLLFYITCGLITFLVFHGCSSVSSYRQKTQAYHHLDSAKELMERGNTGQAINEQKKALKLFPTRPPGDQILYEMGLLLIDPRNQDRNYQQSLEMFQQLIRVFPQSRYREKAEIWSVILSTLIESNARLKKSKAEITTLRDELLHKEQMIQGLREQHKKMKQIDLELNKKRELTVPGEE